MSLFYNEYVRTLSSEPAFYILAFNVITVATGQISNFVNNYFSDLHQEGSVDTPLEEPVIVVASDDAVPSTSTKGLKESISAPLELDDDGGFGAARSKFRNQSLKVDVESSSHRTAHHRSYSDAGRNRKKAEKQAEVMNQLEKTSPNTFLNAPNTKIRKSHSMRYRTDVSPTGAKPRIQTKDDSMATLKRTNTLDPERMSKSPRPHHRRSPHHFQQQQHHTQVHQPSHSSHHQQQLVKHHHRQEDVESNLKQVADEPISHSGHSGHSGQSGHSGHSGHTGHSGHSSHSGHSVHSGHSGHSGHTGHSSHSGHSGVILPPEEITASSFGILPSDQGLENVNDGNPASFKFGNQL
ncbi:hypothetical protein Avbf_04042 [Armadillidium vulgare]|nr:hypothetical protein Avbf_04042 [Armadillidium vulgare]